MALICIFGIRRSGIHALHEYILGCWYNELTKLQIENPRRSGIIFNKHTYYPPSEFSGHVPLQLFSYENKVLPKFDDSLKNIIVLRDPYNWMASTWKMWEKKPLDRIVKKSRKLIKLWLNYAHVFAEGRPGVLMVSFNEWFSSKIYRTTVSNYLGRLHTDYGLDRVRSIGSSFDGHDLDYNAQSMKVMDRWKSMHGLAWKIILEHPLVSIMSKKLFKFCPEPPRYVKGYLS